jgi:hypothetical protein
MYRKWEEMEIETNSIFKLRKSFRIEFSFNWGFKVKFSTFFFLLKSGCFFFVCWKLFMLVFSSEDKTFLLQLFFIYIFKSLSNQTKEQEIHQKFNFNRKTLKRMNSNFSYWHKTIQKYNNQTQLKMRNCAITVNINHFFSQTQQKL